MMSDSPIAKSRNLTVLAYSSGFTQWHYKLPPDHDPENIKNALYWAGVREMMSAGDSICVSNNVYAAMVAVMAQNVDLHYRILMEVKFA